MGPFAFISTIFVSISDFITSMSNYSKVIEDHSQRTYASSKLAGSAKTRTEIKEKIAMYDKRTKKLSKTNVDSEQVDKDFESIMNNFTSTEEE